MTEGVEREISKGGRTLKVKTIFKIEIRDSTGSSGRVTDSFECRECFMLVS